MTTSGKSFVLEWNCDFSFFLYLFLSCNHFSIDRSDFTSITFFFFRDLELSSQYRAQQREQ